jgi:hypothetical protein
VQLHTLSSVSIVEPDRGDTNRIGREGQPVGRHGQGAHLAERLDEHGIGHVSEPQQVGISRGPQRLAEPGQEKQGPLEHEAIGVGRDREAIQEPLGGEAGQDEARVHADGPGVGRQSDLHRSGQSLVGARHVTSDSR